MTADRDSNFPANDGGGPNIYCITGIEPEIHAYAMAKYSRSALSMRQSIRELSQQKAEQFLNTFYFQYGHRSIADLAHISCAIEQLSMLAAIVVVDEQKWDGQERSSRYQNFKKSGYYIPTFPDNLSREFTFTMDRLFDEYDKLSQACFANFLTSIPRPKEMQEDSYSRTLRARAFDVARYLLPLATNTSVGQIVNARTLENQISRLAGDPHPEVRLIGTRLKESATKPPYDVRLEALQELLARVQAKSPGQDMSDFDEILTNAATAPTLVKYADARPYDLASKKELSRLARELLSNTDIAPANAVSIVFPDTLEIELAATLLYEHSHYPYAQLVNFVSGLAPNVMKEIIDLGVKNRGSFDELRRPFAAGQRFQFDILMDIGGFRDMHRHRRCIQILQPYTDLHGYSMPDQVQQIGYESSFKARMEECATLWRTLNHQGDDDTRSNADYVLPLAFRRRALFKMDFAEVVYICELRTGPAGHFSYRSIAYDMYRRVKEHHPELASYMRVHDINEPIDLLRR